jgi:hypothetical protein
MTRTQPDHVDPVALLPEDPAVHDEDPRFRTWLENLLRNGERAGGITTPDKPAKSKTVKPTRAAGSDCAVT